MSRIRVSIQVGRFPSHDDLCVEKDISDMFIEVLDLPAIDAPGMAVMLCSTQETVRRVIRMREGLADGLSKDIAKTIMAALASKDTIMGYPK